MPSKPTVCTECNWLCAERSRSKPQSGNNQFAALLLVDDDESATLPPPSVLAAPGVLTAEYKADRDGMHRAVLSSEDARA